MWYIEPKTEQAKAKKFIFFLKKFRIINLEINLFVSQSTKIWKVNTFLLQLFLNWLCFSRSNSWNTFPLIKSWNNIIIMCFP